MVTNPFRTVWFYNSDTGSVISEPALGDTIQAHLPGWHGPFGTKAEALAYAASSGGKTPTGIAGNVVNEATSGLQGVTTSLGFFKNLFTRANAVRLAEGVLGLVLILVAVSKLAEGTPVGAAVKKVPFI